MTATTDGSTGAPAAPRCLGQRHRPDTVPRGGRGTRGRAHAPMQRATDFLLARQDPEGWWKGDLETNVTMDAEDLLLRQFLGIRDEPHHPRPPPSSIRGEQREDGTWATFYGGPGDLSATVEAYVALRLAGDAPDAPHMARASAWVRDRGRHRRRPGLHPDLARPVRLVEMGGPARTPARAHLLPQVVPAQHLRLRLLGPADDRAADRRLGAKRPVRPAPFPLDELHTDPADPNPPQPLAPRGQLGRRLPAARQGAARLPQGARRAGCAGRAMNAAARWIIERQENDGCWGGIQPPAVYSVIALHLLGYDLEHPVMRGRAGVAGPFRRVARGRRPDDRGLPVPGLGHLPRHHRARRRRTARRPSPAGQGRRLDARRADRAPRRLVGAAARNCRPAAGRSSSTTTTTPTSTTPPRSSSPCAGSRHHDPERVDTAIGRGVRWNLGMQSRNGAWGAFDVDNTSPFPNRLPFCDFGEVIDPPSADVTAHVVEMLAVEGLAHDPRTRRGIEWLLAEQEPDGSWFGRWGVNYVYGTGSVVPALAAAGLPASPPGDPPRRRLAGVGAERRRRLGRGPALLPRRRAMERPRRLHRLPDRVGADGPARGRASRTPRPSSAGVALAGRAPSARTAPGTSRTSPAPASPGTSRSTTTSTGRSSRSPRSAATSHGEPFSKQPRRHAARSPRRGPRGADEHTARPAPAADRLRARHRAPRPAHGRPRRRRRAGHRAAYRHGARGRPKRSVTRLLADPALREAAVLATGFCAGLAPGMHPGDLVVAEETRDPRRHRPASAPTARQGLVRTVPGRTVHTGPLTGSDHVVRGHERAELRATGAIAVDMESAATLLQRRARRARARLRPSRVVVDAPEHELVRIGTVRGGISAFRVLRAVLPAFFEWHRTLLLPRR